MTGNDPRINNPVYAFREPILSQRGPIKTRTSTVIATEAIIVLPTSAFVNIRSSRTTAISGAIPNQPKKAKKNANHVVWKVRIWIVFRLKRFICVALFFISMNVSIFKIVKDVDGKDGKLEDYGKMLLPTFHASTAPPYLRER